MYPFPYLIFKNQPTFPRHARQCRNSIIVIPDKRSAIRNPGTLTSSGCRPAPAWRLFGQLYCYDTASCAGLRRQSILCRNGRWSLHFIRNVPLLWEILFKRKKYALQNSRLINTLLQCKIYSYATCMIHLGSEISCMFFWPEEYWFTSERVDNARIGKLGKIHMRHKDQRICATLHNTILKLAVYFQYYRLRCISTFCSNN